MPSAASVKVEKQSTANISANNAVVAINTAASGENVDNNSPIRQISLIIEHKIRNLEKRKIKLESYRDLEKTGKDLSADKKVAVLKYDEVTMTLDFAREFAKQMEKVVATSEKDLKKKQKKDETLKKQNETSKIRETLLIHDMLRQLRDDIVRRDFLAGTNGACKLDEADLALLDAFAAKVIPNRASLNGVTFKNVCQKAADHLVQTIDGKQKEFETSTYANVKNILKNIQKSSYFDKTDQPSTDISENADDIGENGDIDNNVDDQSIDRTNIVNAEPNTTNSSAGQQQQSLANVHTENHEVFTEQTNKIEAPSASAVPVPQFAPPQIQQTISQPQQQPQSQQSHGIPVTGMNGAKNVKTIPPASPVPIVAGAIPLAQLPPAGHPIPAGVVQPTTVRAVEQAYFKQHQFIQQMRPLAEVLGGGHFHFLQDSELDSPDVPNNNNNSPHPADRQQIGQPPSQSPPQQTAQQTAQQPQQITAVDSNQFFPMIHNPQNNSFPNVVAPNHQMQQQPHIPGFASSAIPIPIPTAAQIPVVQSVQQQATSNSSANSNPLLAQKQPQPFPTATKFVTPTNISENSSHDIHSNSNDLNEHGNDLKNFTSNRTVGSQSNGNNAWHDPYNSNKDAPESNEWNGVPNENGQQDESNTWSSGNSNQRYNQYRQGSGNYRSANNKSTFSKNPSNGGYRGSGNYRSSSNKQTTFSKNNNGNNNNNNGSNSNSSNNNGNSNNSYRGSSNNNFRPSTNKTTFTKTSTNGFRG